MSAVTDYMLVVRYKDGRPSEQYFNVGGKGSEYPDYAKKVQRWQEGHANMAGEQLRFWGEGKHHKNGKRDYFKIDCTDVEFASAVPLKTHYSTPCIFLQP